MPRYGSNLSVLNRWMGKEMCYMYTYIQWNIYNGILLSHKKNTILPFAKTNGLGKYYTEWNNPDWERQILYDITYMCNLRNKTN